MAGEVTSPTGPYRLLLTYGSFFATGKQLAHVSVVLPFILAQQGALWAAALVYPMFSIGYVAGNSLSPFALDRWRRLERLAAVAAVMVGGLIGCIALVALTKVLVALVFLGAAWLIGLAIGIGNNAYAEVASSRLPEMRRNRLLLNQEAIRAFLAVLITLLLVPLLAGRDPAAGHVDLLWLGAAGMVAAGVALLFVRSAPARSDRSPRRMTDTYREGMGVIRTQQWFRRYLLTHTMFVPINLGLMFFSLQASAQHGSTSGSLHVLVISCSIGLVAGSFLWRFVYRRFGVRGMLLASGLLNSLAALICITTELRPASSQVWVHGAVFILATVANMAITAAAISWIGAYAADDQRATLIGFGFALASIASALLGAGLGVLAHSTSTMLPISVVLVLSLVAAVAALRAPGRVSHPVGYRVI